MYFFFPSLYYNIIQKYIHTFGVHNLVIINVCLTFKNEKIYMLPATDSWSINTRIKYFSVLTFGSQPIWFNWYHDLLCKSAWKKKIKNNHPFNFFADLRITTKSINYYFSGPTNLLAQIYFTGPFFICSYSLAKTQESQHTLREVYYGDAMIELLFS